MTNGLSRCARYCAFLLGSTATAGLATVSYAQAAVPAADGSPSASTSPSDDGATVIDIVVTAQRRSESLQKVPIAVTAATSERLQASGITSAADLSLLTPSFSQTNSLGAFQGRIRGIGATTVGAGIESPVAVYVDGVYYGAAAASLFSFSDVERIEVLKGPQGTLFGRNATGGVVNVITKDPSEHIKGSAELGYGNFQTISGSGFLSGPITDQLSASIAVTNRAMGDGYGINLSDGSEANKVNHDFAVRGKLMLRPGDRTTIRLAFDYEDSLGSYPTPRNLSGIKPLLGPAYGGSPWDINSTPVKIATRTGGASLNVEQGIGAIKLVSITAYREVSFTQDIDVDVTPDNLLSLSSLEKDRQLSQEVQLQSGTDSPFTWVVGGYYYWSRNGYAHWDFNYDGFLIADPTALKNINVTGYQTTRSYAAFAQATVPITPTTNITAGLRYTSDRKSIDAVQTVTLVNGFAIPAAAQNSQTYNRLTWRLSIDNQFTTDIMGYASYNRGFKSGGYTTTSPLDPAYQPETLDAYEVGLKMTLADRRIRLNPAFFYYDYQNLQIIYNDAAGIARTANGPKAELYGIDIDGEIAVTKDLSITGGISWIHNQFGDYPNAVFSSPLPGGGNSQAPGQAQGNRIPYTATFSSTLGFNYRLTAGNGALDLTGDWVHSSGFYTEADNGIRQKPYDLFNASITWYPTGGNLYVRAWGKNLSNEPVLAFGVRNGLATGVAYQPPRTYGLSVGFRY